MCTNQESPNVFEARMETDNCTQQRAPNQMCLITGAEDRCLHTTQTISQTTISQWFRLSQGLLCHSILLPSPSVRTRVESVEPGPLSVIGVRGKNIRRRIHGARRSTDLIPLAHHPILSRFLHSGEFLYLAKTQYRT